MMDNLPAGFCPDGPTPNEERIAELEAKVAELETELKDEQNTNTANITLADIAYRKLQSQLKGERSSEWALEHMQKLRNEIAFMCEAIGVECTGDDDVENGPKAAIAKLEHKERIIERLGDMCLKVANLPSARRGAKGKTAKELIEMAEKQAETE